MATITKMNPSAAANGIPVKIVPTATAGQLFHTAHATAQDEIWLYLTNTDVVQRQVTIEFGGPTAPDQNINVPVPALDTVLAIAGIPLSGGLTVKAFADAANKVNMYGYINRIA